jgi:hypothetical protein
MLHGIVKVPLLLVNMGGGMLKEVEEEVHQDRQMMGGKGEEEESITKGRGIKVSIVDRDGLRSLASMASVLEKGNEASV